MISKKFRGVLLALLLIPYSTFAISFHELENNPSKYVIVHNAPTVAGYVDINSIKMIRQSFPFITIDARFFIVSFNSKMILEDMRSFTFDINHSLLLRAMELERKYPNCTEEELLKMLALLQVQNSGVILGSPHLKAFNFEGVPNAALVDSLEYGIDTPDRRKVSYIKVPWDVANFIFNRCSKDYKSYFGLPSPYATYEFW